MPAPDIRSQRRLLDIVIPNTEILVVLRGALLASAVQHTVGGVFQILPKALYGMIVPAHPVMAAVPTDDGRYVLHRLRYWLVYTFFEACLGYLPFRLQFLLACADSQPVLPCSGLGVEEENPRKSKSSVVPLNRPIGSILVVSSATSSDNFPSRFGNTFMTFRASFSY